MMSDTQELLAKFVSSRSEAAFRELVTRYFDLVYSTAVRLVDGDTHRAEDVAQVVFSDLARMANKLSDTTMLGGCHNLSSQGQPMGADGPGQATRNLRHSDLAFPQHR
jgi:hypothetical protein